MKTFITFTFSKAVTFLFFLLFLSANLQSQPQYYNYNTTGSGNSFPFNIPIGKQVQVLFLPGDFNQPSPAPAGNITSVSFRMAANLGPYTYSDFLIKMGQSAITTFATGSWYQGQLDTVYSRSSVTLSGTANEWLSITLDRPFAYDPAMSLIIDVQQCGAPGATGFSTGTTTLPGFRRNTSLLGSSCPFPWGQQSGTTPHMGVNIGPSNCSYSWTNQISGTTQALRTVKAVSELVAWTAGAAGTVRKTTDGGVTWTDGNPNPGVINGLIYNIDAFDANTAWCTTSPAATYIYKTTNGGVNWTQVFTQPGGFINGIQFINSNTGFAEGDPVSGRWSLWKSTDAGSTWDSSGLYAAQVGTEAGWVNSVFAIGNNIWFGTSNTVVYKSTDFGTSWSFGATTGLVNSYSVHYNSPSLGLAGGTTIVKTTDGGLTYSGVGTVPGTGNINGIEGKDNNFWYVRGTGIFRSSNEGNNWTQVHTLTGTANDIDFPESSGCLTGWAVSSTGLIAKMTGVIVGVNNNITSVPDKYYLGQNYPNPFNPSTVINYEIPVSDLVTLRIYDITGREVASLVNGNQESGKYSIEWNASQFASGTYFYTIKAGGFTQTKKMILLK